VIKNVCIHVENEQPLLVDLYDLPTSADAGLLCTNVRTMDGKRPVFIDDARSTFFFPYHVVRFLEIPERQMAGRRVTSARRAPEGRPADEPLPEDARLDGDDGTDAEDGSLLPVAVGAPEEPDPEDLELEIDEGFLQRIRDI
jgi:hypothetical protein